MSAAVCEHCGAIDGGHTLACQSIHKEGPKPQQGSTKGHSDLPAHVRSSAEFLAKRLNNAPCDSEAVSGCVRCSALVLARHLLGIKPPPLRMSGVNS